MSEPVRLLPMTVNPDGTTQWNSILSPDTFRVRGAVMRTPDRVIPIIFLPGIMGTNLRSKKGKKESVWSPPNGTAAGLGEGISRGFQKAEKRQSSLTPENTEVDDSGEINVPDALRWFMGTDQARQRGWGTVHWDSYGSILLFLEEQLNLPFSIHENTGQQDKPVQPDWLQALHVPTRTKSEKWSTKEPSPCALDDVKKLARNYLLPVHAVGYNWLQSNGDSAVLVAEKMDAIKKAYEKSGRIKVKGFIVVTHSMGGLVARRLVQLPSVKNLILGVVHGVQPVHGAAAVYRRLQAGTEAEVNSWNPVKHIEGSVTSTILGSSTRDTTPVLGQAPGTLELLPNQYYNHGKPWLFADTLHFKDTPGKNGASRTFETKHLLALPKADPYEEIYGNRDAWYRLVDEDVLDPADLHAGSDGNQKGWQPPPRTEAEFEKVQKDRQKKRDLAWGGFKDLLSVAKQFHNSVTNKGKEFHPCTYAYFGDDKEQRSYTSLHWIGSHAMADIDEQALKKGKRLGSSGKGTISVDFTPPGTRQDPLRNPYLVHFDMSAKDSAGDGTVPTCSSEAVEGYGLKATFRLKGFDHQKSYMSSDARHVTLYSIMQIVKENAFNDAK